jgi:hypothetical protein
VPCVLYGCVTWSHVLTEECRLRAFENGVLRKNRHKREEVTGKCENCIIWSSIKRSTQTIFLGSSNEGG